LEQEGDPVDARCNLFEQLHVAGFAAGGSHHRLSLPWTFPRQESLACVFPMSSDRIIADGIKVAQDLLRQNLPPTHNLTDAAVVLRFRELVRSQAIRSALERSSDTVLAFALREVERVLCDQSRPHRETIKRLWDVLDDPHLNQALGLPQQSRMTRR
jgi:hypothetical protein